MLAVADDLAMGHVHLGAASFTAVPRRLSRDFSGLCAQSGFSEQIVSESKRMKLQSCAKMALAGPQLCGVAAINVFRASRPASPANESGPALPFNGAGPTLSATWDFGFGKRNLGCDSVCLGGTALRCAVREPWLT